MLGAGHSFDPRTPDGRFIPVSAVEAALFDPWEPDEATVEIDFTGHKDLLESLEEEAKRSYRTVEGQILWYLSLHKKGKERREDG